MTDYFDHYMFTSNATNFVCPAWLFGGYTWSCLPPNACATDPSTTKQYCCDAGDVCWTAPSVCASDGSTFTCSSGSYTWCCLKNKFVHTLRSPEAGKKGKELKSLTFMQRDLHAAGRPGKHMLELGSRYPHQHQQQRA
jgi:hypothetical protein